MEILRVLLSWRWVVRENKKLVSTVARFIRRVDHATYMEVFRALQYNVRHSESSSAQRKLMEEQQAQQLALSAAQAMGAKATTEVATRATMKARKQEYMIRWKLSVKMSKMQQEHSQFTLQKLMQVRPPSNPAL